MVRTVVEVEVKSPRPVMKNKKHVIGEICISYHEDSNGSRRYIVTTGHPENRGTPCGECLYLIIYQEKETGNIRVVKSFATGLSEKLKSLVILYLCDCRLYQAR